MPTLIHRVVTLHDRLARFSGVATILAVGILDIPQLGTQDISHALEWTFLTFLPNFCLGQGLEDFYSNYEFSEMCHQFNLTEICKFPIPFPCCKGEYLLNDNVVLHQIIFILYFHLKCFV